MNSVESNKEQEKKNLQAELVQAQNEVKKATEKLSAL